MSKSFCEFLIEQKQISEDILLECFIEHINKLPSLTEFIYQNNFFSKTDFFKILLNQQENNIDFISSAKKLSLWNSELDDAIIKKYTHENKSVTEIIIEKGLLNLDAISALINKYVDICSSSLNQKNVQENNKNQNEEKVEKQVEKVIEIPQVQNQVFNSTVLNEYIQFFEETSNISLKKNLNLLKESCKDEKKFFESYKLVLSELITLRAAINYLGASKSQKIVDKLISFLNDKKTTAISMVDDLVVRIETSLEIIGAYCNSLKNFSNEEQIEEKYKNILTKLEV